MESANVRRTFFAELFAFADNPVISRRSSIRHYVIYFPVIFGLTGTPEPRFEVTRKPRNRFSSDTDPVRVIGGYRVSSFDTT